MKPYHTDILVSFWHEFINSAAVDTGLLLLKAIANSHFCFLVFVVLAIYRVLLLFPRISFFARAAFIPVIDVLVLPVWSQTRMSFRLFSYSGIILQPVTFTLWAG